MGGGAVRRQNLEACMNRASCVFFVAALTTCWCNGEPSVRGEAEQPVFVAAAYLSGLQHGEDKSWLQYTHPTFAMLIKKSITGNDADEAVLRAVSQLAECSANWGGVVAVDQYSDGGVASAHYIVTNEALKADPQLSQYAVQTNKLLLIRCDKRWVVAPNVNLQSESWASTDKDAKCAERGSKLTFSLNSSVAESVTNRTYFKQIIFETNPATCPDCCEYVSHDWRYCPLCGRELQGAARGRAARVRPYNRE